MVLAVSNSRQWKFGQSWLPGGRWSTTGPKQDGRRGCPPREGSGEAGECVCAEHRIPELAQKLRRRSQAWSSLEWGTKTEDKVSSQE